MSKTTYYDTLQSSALCSLSEGYNFKFSPDSTEKLFFGESGLYRLIVTFSFLVRNPMAVSVQFVVE